MIAKEQTGKSRTTIMKQWNRKQKDAKEEGTESPTLRGTIQRGGRMIKVGALSAESGR